MNIFEDSTKSMLLRGFRVRSPEIIKKNGHENYVLNLFICKYTKGRNRTYRAIACFRTINCFLGASEPHTHTHRPHHIRICAPERVIN